MPEDPRRDDIITEIADLFEKQRAAMQEATFIGWTEASRAAFGERGDRAAQLLKQIAATEKDAA